MHLLSEIVDQAAGHVPEAEAFRCAGEGITYADLATQTSQLARFLVNTRISPGDRVGVFLPRSLPSAVAVYGVLKAGAAFVPIDPQSPIERVAGIIRDCQITHLVSAESLQGQILKLIRSEPGLGLRFIIGIQELDCPASCRVTPWDEIFQGPRSEYLVRTQETDLAYLMYTSGSTGKPKGIMHSHRSGYLYADQSRITYKVSHQDRIGNHSPLHFDMSTFGYLTSPLAGATSVIIPEAYTKIPASLSQLIDSEKLTIWYSVPLVLLQLLERGVVQERDFDSLRWVLFGGEPMASKHLSALRRVFRRAAFSNVYGPAEVNQCTHFDVPAYTTAPEYTIPNRVPIGKAWPQAELRVEGSSDNGIGELLVCTDTMMKGYWNRADLTNQSLVRDEQSDQTFYRTGDLVEPDANGDFVFLGRKDRQIKLKGNRIELDEIELALSCHPDIHEVGVYPIKKDGLVQAISASVTLNNSLANDANEQAMSSVSGREKPSPSGSDLVQYLKGKIPPYALPQTILICDSLPRTTSGKVDRRQLQEAAEAKLL